MSLFTIRSCKNAEQMLKQFIFIILARRLYSHLTYMINNQKVWATLYHLKQVLLSADLTLSQGQGYSN